ncbi:sugar phosphate permease [Ameyamaea chiangmaiensis NBRC 103196]|nr:sugar phosphate permease [Ameyamaea chiangmaiensis NBRC 103196]
MYLIAFLDRANVAIARQALHTDVGITETLYALGAGIFFLGYALCEVPSNILLDRLGARLWIARIMVTWGVVSASTMLISGPKSFLLVRILLGIAEAGFFPGVMLYLTFWFPKKERATALALFYFGFPLSMMLGTPASAALLSLDGLAGLRGWQWMFFLEGGLAVLAGVATFFILPDGPESVSWLAPAQKEALKETLEAEDRQTICGETRHGWGALLSPRMALITSLYVVLQIVTYGLVFYLPSQISALLNTQMGAKAGLVGAIPWISALILTPVIVRLIARRNMPILGVSVCLLVFALGLYGSTIPTTWLALACLCMATSATVSAQAMFWNVPMSYLTAAQAATGLAVINSVGNLGGFVAPNLRALADNTWHSDHAGIYACAIVALIGIAITVAITGFAKSSDRRPTSHCALEK